MSQRRFRIESVVGLRPAIIAAERAIEATLKGGRGCLLIVSSSVRSGPQNNKLQVMCGELEEVALWHGQKLTHDEWRHLFVSGVLGAKVIPGLNGGFLSLIRSSKDLTEKQASDCIETINAWVAENGYSLKEAA